MLHCESFYLFGRFSVHLKKNSIAINVIFPISSQLFFLAISKNCRLTKIQGQGAAPIVLSRIMPNQTSFLVCQGKTPRYWGVEGATGDDASWFQSGAIFSQYSHKQAKKKCSKK